MKPANRANARIISLCGLIEMARICYVLVKKERPVFLRNMAGAVVELDRILGGRK